MPKTTVSREPSEASIGMKYGKLTVISITGMRETKTGRKIPVVLCECECGKRAEKLLWDLRSGKTKTCGFDHPHFDDRTLPAFNYAYNHAYRHQAKRRGLLFDISKEDFRRLCESNCHYCGSEPDNVSSRGLVKSGKYTSEWRYNGLDRKDSNKDYTLDNVVPCCAICNRAKGAKSYKQFIAWIEAIKTFKRVDSDGK